MTAFSPTAVRASEIARCERMAALRALGATPVEPDEDTRRYFARGHLYTDYVCRQLEARFGKDAVQREVEIEHPLGVGHADAYIAPAKTLVEIKSTVTPTTSSPMFDMAVAQLRIYLRYHGEAEQGILYLVNPSSLSREDEFTVMIDDDDIAAIDEAVARVSDAIRTGTLPERVCARPSQARGRLCPFAVACFDGWEEPPADEVTEPEALNAAARLYALKQQLRTQKAAITALEADKKEAESELAERVPVGDSIVGSYTIKRTHVVRQPTVSLKAAEAAGFPVDTLDEFLRPGAEYDTWTIEQADKPGDIDYGDEVPF